MSGFKLRYEENEQLTRANGAESLWQVQESVRKIVCETKKKIAKGKGGEKKYRTFLEGLYRIKCTLNE